MLISEFMPPPSQLLPASFGLGAVMLWGTSDFIGGYAVRRAPAFLFTTISHASGTSLMIAFALLNRSAFPGRTSTEWAIAAGAFAGIALATFYRALAEGQMGLNAPVSAVLSVLISATVGILTEGLPGRITIAGFVLAGVGIWLISRAEVSGRPAGLGLAALSGIGFAAYFLCTKQAGSGSALWIAGLSRASSFVATGAVVLFARKLPSIALPDVAFALLAGAIDVSGSVFFVRAAQTGRLDTAVVISSLYPAITVVLARLILREHFTRWKMIGMLAALLAVPMIAAG